MATITLSNTIYNKAQIFANENNITVDDLISSLIKQLTLTRKQKKSKLKPIEELSPSLQQFIGFAKPKRKNKNDINGDLARTEYLNSKLSN